MKCVFEDPSRTKEGSAKEKRGDQKERQRPKGGTPHLDGQYTVFGEVVEGLDIVEKIQGVVTDDMDRPLEDVRIIKAERVK